LYERSRIDEENVLLEQYALKNKREVWKAQAKLRYLRTRAKQLSNASPEEQMVYFKKLQVIGFPVQTTADVLALTIEDVLKRRLSSLVLQKGLASTPKQARQLIVHKHITINGRTTNAPSYLVPVAFESSIQIKEGHAKRLPVKAEKAEEANE